MNDELVSMVDVAPEVLAQLLQLPEGVFIDAVTTLIEAPGVLRLRLRGCGWKVAPGRRIPMLVPTLTRRESTELQHRIVIDWGLPT